MTSWKASNDGPVTQQSFLHGDTIDTRKAWEFASPGFKDKGWKTVETKRPRCREAHRAGWADGAEDQ